MTEEFERPENWKEEYKLDLDKIELETAAAHDWVQVGNQLLCRKHPGQHMSYLPEGASV